MAQWKTIASLVVILLAVCSGYLFAQAPKSATPRGEEPAEMDSRMDQAIDMMFRQMDADHDGKISKSEWMAFQEKHFMSIDKKGRGYITRDDVKERMKEEQERMRGRKSPQ